MRSSRLAALAALSMIIGSTAAVAQSAAPQSISVSAGESTEGSSELDRRGVGIYIIGAVVLGLIIWGIIELTDDENSSSP